MTNTVSRNPIDYGFDRPDDIENGIYEEFLSSYIKIVNRRKKRWDDNEPNGKGMKLKRFVRKGIPPENRARIWMELSGAASRMKDNPGLYKSLTEATPDLNNSEVIQADLPRTFPENCFFRNIDEPSSRMTSLGRILSAFTVKNTKIGYCQGLNYICAVFLLIVEDEEKSFWLLNTLVTEILPKYYHPDMTGVQVDCLVLEELIRKKFPEVFHVMKQADVSCDLLCTKWFICLFADVLPIETVLRIFDCLFYEGDKILFRAALTLIKMNENRLKACHNFPSVVTTFKEIVHDRSALFCHDFMLNLFKMPGSLSRKLIRSLREECSRKLKHKAENGRGDDSDSEE